MIAIFSRSKNIKFDLNTDSLANSRSKFNNNSLVTGTNEQDRLVGGNKDQEIQGYSEDDYLNGAAGADLLRGGKGNDELIGGQGNDTLAGWNGNDILVGVDPTDANPGYQEIDRLQGHGGKDTFVLGDANTVYYNHQGTGAESWQDRAIIKDFSSAKDTIQLHGSADNYQLVAFSSGTKIFYGETGTQFKELIAIVKNVNTNLDLSGSEFTYV